MFVPNMGERMLLNLCLSKKAQTCCRGWSIGYSAVKFKNAFSVRCKKDTRGQKAMCSTIPIVFQVGDDPMRLGLVASLARPGGNMTGVTSLNVEIGPKQFELLHELVPAARSVALLVNPGSPTQSEATTREARAAAARLGLELHIVEARSERDFDAVFATLAGLRAGALAIIPDSLFTAGESNSAPSRSATQCSRSARIASSPRPVV
jgi:hypothetical protein